MPWGVAALAVGVIGAASSASAGKKAQQASNDAAFASEMQGAREQARTGIEAQYIKLDAAERAQRIKQQALFTKGQQIASMASSGVIVGNGSSRTMIDETKRLAEQDALVALMDGTEQAVMKDIAGSDAAERSQAAASSYASQGEAAHSRGQAGAWSSIGSGISGYASS